MTSDEAARQLAHHENNALYFSHRRGPLNRVNSQTDNWKSRGDLRSTDNHQELGAPTTHSTSEVSLLVC